MDSEVSGIFSAMASIKTENASRTVTPRAIFSPVNFIVYNVKKCKQSKMFTRIGRQAEDQYC